LLNYFIEANEKDHSVIIQEIVPGEVTDRISYCAYFDKKQKSIVSFYYSGIRAYPDDFGNLVLIKNVEPIKKLEEMIKDIVDEIGFLWIIGSRI
jgi:predicted ATP-grasp superfamily ATP-dependent carboligase